MCLWNVGKGAVEQAGECLLFSRTGKHCPCDSAEWPAGALLSKALRQEEGGLCDPEPKQRRNNSDTVSSFRGYLRAQGGG